MSHNMNYLNSLYYFYIVPCVQQKSQNQEHVLSRVPFYLISLVELLVLSPPPPQWGNHSPNSPRNSLKTSKRAPAVSHTSSRVPARALMRTISPVKQDEIEARQAPLTNPISSLILSRLPPCPDPPSPARTQLQGLHARLPEGPPQQGGIRALS